MWLTNDVSIFSNAIRLQPPPKRQTIQPKNELETSLTYFWHKNEKKISPSLFLYSSPYDFDTHALAFYYKICSTNKVNTISGGGQLLVSGSQGPISKIPGVMSHVPGLQVPSPRVPVPGSWIPGSQVLGSWGLRVPGLRSWFWTVPMLAPSFQLILIYKNWYRWATSVKHDCDALCDLVPFVQFLKCEKHPWRSVALTKVATLLKVTLFHGCFSLF